MYLTCLYCVYDLCHTVQAVWIWPRVRGGRGTELGLAGLKCRTKKMRKGVKGPCENRMHSGEERDRERDGGVARDAYLKTAT